MHLLTTFFLALSLGNTIAIMDLTTTDDADIAAATSDVDLDSSQSLAAQDTALSTTDLTSTTTSAIDLDSQQSQTVQETASLSGQPTTNAADIVAATGVIDLASLQSLAAQDPAFLSANLFDQAEGQYASLDQYANVPSLNSTDPTYLKTGYTQFGCRRPGVIPVTLVGRGNDTCLPGFHCEYTWLIARGPCRELIMWQAQTLPSSTPLITAHRLRYVQGSAPPKRHVLQHKACTSPRSVTMVTTAPMAKNRSYVLQERSAQVDQESRSIVVWDRYVRQVLNAKSCWRLYM